MRPACCGTRGCTSPSSSRGSTPRPRYKRTRRWGRRWATTTWNSRSVRARGRRKRPSPGRAKRTTRNVPACWERSPARVKPSATRGALYVEIRSAQPQIPTPTAPWASAFAERGHPGDGHTCGTGGATAVVRGPVGVARTRRIGWAKLRFGRSCGLGEAAACHGEPMGVSWGIGREELVKRGAGKAEGRTHCAGARFGGGVKSRDGLGFRISVYSPARRWISGWDSRAVSPQRSRNEKRDERALPAGLRSRASGRGTTAAHGQSRSSSDFPVLE